MLMIKMQRQQYGGNDESGLRYYMAFWVIYGRDLTCADLPCTALPLRSRQYFLPERHIKVLHSSGFCGRFLQHPSLNMPGMFLHL